MLPFFHKQWEEAHNWARTAVLQAIQAFLLKQRAAEFCCRLLCVDDDHSFCHFIQRLAHSLGIQVDEAYSVNEAKQAIQKYPHYAAYIVDGHLPDGTGFELVAWMREKKSIKSPIGFITRIYQDANSFRLLKEKLHVDYVLDKPLQPGEAHQLLIQLCHLEPELLPPDPYASDIMVPLKETYEKTIFDKVERLEKLILAVEKNPTIDNFQALRTEIHRMAGSAGTFGYMAVSEICKGLETELSQQMDLIEKGEGSPRWLLNLDDYFVQIKLHYQIFLPDESQERMRAGQLSSLYIVDEDQSLLEGFYQLAQKLPFYILAETRVENAIRKMLTSEFYPQILLLCIRYPSSSITGTILLNAFYKKSDYLTTVVAFMAENEASNDITDALMKGVTFILEKPINPSLVFHLLDQSPFRALPFHYKVLIIDDDPDTCAYLVQALKYAGLEVNACPDYHGAEKQVRLFQPDLILLDINLADDLGVQSLAKLKKLKRAKVNQVIGMVTLTFEETYDFQAYFEAGVDDIIFKPLDKSILQRKVAAFLKRAAKQITAIEEDSITGFENAQTLGKHLEALQNRPYPPFPKILILFEMDNFATLDPLNKKEIIASLSESLGELQKKYELAADLGEGCFALIFQGFDPHFVQLFMRSFFVAWKTELTKTVSLPEIGVNESLTILSPGQSADEIIQGGLNLLQLARHLPDTVFRLIMEPTYIPLKEVFIFHDGQESIKAFASKFKKQGFKVTLKTSIEEEAIRSVIPLPLLILTGSFANLKGLPLLKKWSMQNQVQIPHLLLSRETSQKELFHLLHKVNYFKAPFSLVIMIT